MFVFFSPQNQTPPQGTYSPLLPDKKSAKILEKEERICLNWECFLLTGQLHSDLVNGSVYVFNYKHLNIFN